MKPPLHLAKEQDLRAIGIEPVAADARRAALLSKLGSMVESSRSLSVPAN